jgi:GNAT superfamily N-acetyltransferase
MQRLSCAKAVLGLTWGGDAAPCVQGKPVCCAVFRIFGAALAEVPLVATRLGARRCGHARVLMAALEHLCTDLGVARLALPAAASTVDTWVGGFGFRPMTEEEAAATRQELRMLIFPGARARMRYSCPCLAALRLPPLRNGNFFCCARKSIVLWHLCWECGAVLVAWC